MAACVVVLDRIVLHIFDDMLTLISLYFLL